MSESWTFAKPKFDASLAEDLLGDVAFRYRDMADTAVDVEHQQVEKVDAVEFAVEFPDVHHFTSP